MAGNGTAEAGRQFNRGSRLALLVLCAGLVLALSGCVGGGGGGIGGGGVDFTLSISPGSQSVTAGNTIAYVIAANQTSGLGPLVQLSVSGLPPGSASAFSDPVVSAPGTSTLTILTAPNTSPATFNLTITGTDLTGKQTTQAMLTVNAGPPPIDFVMDVTPASRTTLGGGSVSYTVSVSSDNAAPVNLSVSGLPAGATGTFNPAGITGQGMSTLTVTTVSPTSPGFYGLNVIGADSTGTQKVPITLNIASVDFTLQQFVGPSAVTAGGNIFGTVTATPVLGSLGTVTLSVTAGLPPGASANFSPNPLGGSVTSSTMTITTTTSLAAGEYQLSIQGSDASGIQTAQIPVRVLSGNPSAGFFLAAVPDQAEIQARGQAQYIIIMSNKRRYGAGGHVHHRRLAVECCGRHCTAGEQRVSAVGFHGSAQRPERGRYRDYGYGPGRHAADRCLAAD